MRLIRFQRLIGNSVSFRMGPKILFHSMLSESVGALAATGPTAAQQELYKEFSAITHIDKKDPPVFGTTVGDNKLPCKTVCIHAPEFGRRLKIATDAAGAESYWEHRGKMRQAGRHFAKGNSPGDGIEKPPGSTKEYANAMEFIFDQVGMDVATAEAMDSTGDWCGKRTVTWLC